jgi:hypothetical protein
LRRERFPVVRRLRVSVCARRIIGQFIGANCAPG